MDEFNVNSPLSTRAKRDKFVRPPLSVLGAETPKPGPAPKKSDNATVNPDETITHTLPKSTSDTVGKDVTDRRLLSSSKSSRSTLNSATSTAAISDFRTSSPITAGGIGHDHTSPQLSMIGVKTPEAHSSSRKNVSRENGTVKKTLVCEEGSSDEDQTTSSSNSSQIQQKSSRSSQKPVVPNQSKITDDNASNKDLKKRDEIPCTFCSFFFILLGLFAPVFLNWYLGARARLDDGEGFPVSVPSNFDRFSRFKLDLDKIQLKFPHQNPKLWPALSGVVRRNMLGKPNTYESSSPCFLFLHNETAKTTTDCLVRAISTSLFSAYNSRFKGDMEYIKSTDFTQDDPDEAKAKLFAKIDSGLRENSVVVLEDISKLKASPLMALPGICDVHYMDGEKIKPVFLMTIFDGRSEEIAVPKGKYNPYGIKDQVFDSWNWKFEAPDFDRAANLMRSLWEKELGYEKLKPVINQIADVVITILPEEFKECPHM